MVRCEQFYEYWERKGNFCGKSDGVAKQVEHYIEYINRNRLRDYGGFRISNCALDPFMAIEDAKYGKVHNAALKELKTLIRKRKVKPDKLTRRASIEIINRVNMNYDILYRLENIPGIRKRMGEFEHEINEISFEARSMFNEFKDNIEAKNNNQALMVMLEYCIRNPEEIKRLKDDMENRQEIEKDIEIVKVT